MKTSNAPILRAPRAPRGLRGQRLQRLKWLWAATEPSAYGSTARDADQRTYREPSPLQDILGEKAAEFYTFDALQLSAIIAVCQQHRSFRDAGRELFSISREQGNTPNDADRLRKFLLKYGLSWNIIFAL